MAGGALALLPSVSLHAQSAAPPAPQFSFARAAAALVARYHLIPGELASGNGPTLEIYGDGRVVRRYPASYTRAGEHQLWLPAAELDRLLQSLVAAGIVDFDPAAVGEAKRLDAAARRAAAAAGGRPTVFAVSDPATVEIEVRLERYRPPGVAQPEQRGVVKTIRWTDLETDRRLHPDIAALQGLAAADREFRSLLDRSGFVRVE